MNKNTKRVLFWTPRILGILFTILLSLFAFDVFEGNYGFWQTIGALLLHLIPAFILAIVLIIAWRWELVGAVVFIAFAVFYVGMSVSWGHFPLIAILFISGPLLLIGILFLLNHIYRAELRAK